MRTTVTLDPDVEAKLRAVMRERGVSFKAAINDAVRAGLGGTIPAARPYRMPTAPLGVRPGVNLDKALMLAGEMEDEETLRKMALGK
ncbi:MAG TPA: CopG family transcriptional regulator [Solirubrobacteraceae bacterium]|nr:CopG family transcriptional regulator [Solirubrobacteraceae bacterium]